MLRVIRLTIAGVILGLFVAAAAGPNLVRADGFSNEQNCYLPDDGELIP